MPNVCLYLQIHQPHRLRRFRVFEIGNGGHYFDDEANAEIMDRVARRSYLPAARVLSAAVRRHGGAFRFALGITATAIEQMAEHAPEALEAFRALVGTGSVELLGETSHHSLAWLHDREEFRDQVVSHRRLLRATFGASPEVFRNTELLYDDALAPAVGRLGFRAILAEGAEGILGLRSPTQVYAAESDPAIRLLLRHYPLSDDVAFRYAHTPLPAERYARWIAATPGDTVNLFLDFETFGEHQVAETRILRFLEELPDALAEQGLRFRLPSELASEEPAATLGAKTPVSWADTERDESAWLGNDMQRAAAERLYRLLPRVVETGDPRLYEIWRRLSASDHLYYMSTKRFSDGEVHAHFSPWESPYDAFIAFMNVLSDLEERVSSSRSERRAA